MHVNIWALIVLYVYTLYFCLCVKIDFGCIIDFI